MKTLGRLWLVCWLLVGAAVAVEPKPNIVFILADDLGINDVGCYGRKDQPTPNLDRLAAEGTRFTQAYCAQPICSPTRAAILTGKTPARLHLTSFLPGRADAPSQLLLNVAMEQHLAAGEKTVAQWLKPAGYVTACLGKWHVGGKGFEPRDFGFDTVFAGQAVTKPSATEGGKGEYELTAQAEAFIEANKERPFFLYLAHNSVHVPLGAKADLLAKHANAWNPTMAAMLDSLDECVGRVVAKIDALGLGEQTLVIFTSDNGGLHVQEGDATPSTHNTPYRAGKGFLYEGGLRIPLIVRWPGKVPAGREEATPVISTDWLPTWLEIAGEPQAPGLDGVSLAGVLDGTRPLAKRALYWHFPHYTNQGSRPAGAVREGDWKLVEHYEDGHAELFDLAHDPGEATDLSMQEPGRVADLRGKLAIWRQAVGAQENTVNPQFDPAWHRALYTDFDPSRLTLGTTAAAMRTSLDPWRGKMNAILKPGTTDKVREVIRLPASAAQVHAEKLRYEPQPIKNTLGFWVKAEDWAEWKFEVKTAGRFDVQILQGCGKGSAGADVDFIFDDQAVPVKVIETGHFQNFVPRLVGTVTLGAGSHTLSVKPRTKPGAAVMDLRQVTLLPALP